MKLKVLHLVKTATGATWALRQMRELVRLGVDVHVALPPDGPLVPEYQAAGIAVHSLQCDFPVRAPWLWHGLFRQFRNLVAHVEPDIIHSHFVGTTVTMRLALGKRHAVPRIFQVPGPLHLEHAFFRYVEITTAGTPDYWIGSCEWTCERYRESGIPPEQVFLSYYGIDLDTFASHNPDKLRKELDIDEKIKLVGMVAFMYAPKRFLGQTRGLKGHEDLIDAIAICLKTEPNIKCIFVGGAWNNAIAYERQVRAYAGQRLGDNVVFLGTRSDVAEIYPDFDVVVHPSHSENVGGAAESLLLAVPTIATNVGGFPDLVKSGDTGWLVPPQDPAHLAAAILAAVRNPVHSHTMAVNGQHRARQLFDVREKAQEVLKIYKTVVSRHGIRRTGNLSYVQ